jgi:hypothetical protein
MGYYPDKYLEGYKYTPYVNKEQPNSIYLLKDVKKKYIKI